MPHKDATENVIAKEKYTDSTFVIRENLESIAIRWDEPAIFQLYQSVDAKKPKYYYATVENTPYPDIPQCTYTDPERTFDYWVDINANKFGSTTQ